MVSHQRWKYSARKVEAERCCDKKTENTFHFAAQFDNLVTKEEVDVMYLDKKPSKFEQDVPERVVIPAHSTSYPILIEDIIKKLSRPII